MGTISLSIPVVGQPDTSEDVKVQNDFTTLQNVINGNIDLTNLSTATKTSFLQLLSAQQLQLAVGSTNLTWPGSNQYSNILTVSHGIGRTPQGVFAIAAGFIGSGTNVYLNGPLTNTSLVFQAKALDVTPGAGNTATIYWAAFG